MKPLIRASNVNALMISAPLRMFFPKEELMLREVSGQ
jgi:hypothetical protein